MLRRTRLAIAAGALLASLTLTAGLASAAGWVGPVPLNVSATAGAASPAVGIDATGNTIVTWQTNPGAPPHVIQGARHAVGGIGFQQLPDIASDAALSNADAIAVVNRAGRGFVAWVHDTSLPSTQQVQMSPISPGGIVGAAQPISGPATGTYSDLGGAINANGDAVIGWNHNNNIVEAITRTGLGGSFTSPQALDAGGGLGLPVSVAIDSGGNAMAVWPTAATAGALFVKRHAAGGSSWSLSESIATSGHVYTQQTASANPNGQVVVAFLDSTASVVGAATGTVSGGFGALSVTGTTLSSPGVTHGPGVNVADTGGTVVGWTTGSAVQFSQHPGGSLFPPPAGVQSITPVPVMPANFELAGNGRGDVIAGWYGFETSAGHNVARAAVKPAGNSSFGASKVISDPTRDSYDERIALDENGDAVVGLSLGSSGGPLGVEAAVYDGSPPILGSLKGPTRLARGARGSFSTSATDAFSTVRFSWSFGDGSATAAGGSASHTFTRTGRFTVKVTATDTAGNQAAKQITVTVTSPPPPCVVPKLKGKTLSQAKTLLRRAHCKLGRVHKPKPRKHHKLGKLVISSQSPSAHKRRANGTKVSLTLKPAPKPKPKHKH